MTVIILFLLIKRELRNVRKLYRGPLMIDGVFSPGAASVSFTTSFGGQL
jgi:hypothetical protein